MPQTDVPDDDVPALVKDALWEMLTPEEVERLQREVERVQARLKRQNTIRRELLNIPASEDRDAKD